MKLWSEIKQRRITQIVVAYLVGGWLALSVIDQVVDREVFPTVVYEVALTLYLVGIAAALVIGWYHGEKGEQRAPAAEIVTLVVIAGVALFLSWRVVQADRTGARLADALDTGDLSRIAVLYLEDVSAGADIQAEADGITEGLIAELRARAGAQLTVASRNASRQVRGQNLRPDSIASLLEVGALVDGTLDVAGDELRVSVRLLEGASGVPLYRQTFSWPRDSVASVGTALAGEVARALREELGVEIRARAAQANAPNRAAWLQVARAEQALRSAKDGAQNGDVDAVVNGFGRAEEQLEAAMESAPEWPEPRVLRAQVAYERYILAQSVDELISMMAEAEEWANRALELNPTHPGALEWRGTARYRRWLLQAEDETTLAGLFNGAKADLERSISLDASRASVNSTLSHLYYRTEDWGQAILAAREAYRQDAFLDAADGVLWRLYTASYDLGDHTESERWCREGHDRFPTNFRFVLCQAWLLTMPDAEPDINEAWAAYDELLPVLVERPEFFQAQARIVVGGVIGRAGLPDSAQAVFTSAQVPAAVDPDRELWATEAAMRSVMGDVDGALERLERYVVAQEGNNPGQHWWWDNLRGNPRFERLR